MSYQPIAARLRSHVEQLREAEKRAAVFTVALPPAALRVLADDLTLAAEVIEFLSQAPERRAS